MTTTGSFWDDMLARVEALPGVSRAGIITVQPLSGFVPGGLVHLNGDPSKTGNGGYIVASPGLFEALDIPLLRGRTFDETDGPDARHSVVVNQSFADAYWPGEDPIGKQVSGGGFDNFWDSDPLVFGTVVGVVADVRYRDLTQAGEPVVYWNYRQRPARIQQGQTWWWNRPPAIPASWPGVCGVPSRKRTPTWPPRSGI